MREYIATTGAAWSSCASSSTTPPPRLRPMRQLHGITGIGPSLEPRARGSPSTPGSNRCRGPAANAVADRARVNRGRPLGPHRSRGEGAAWPRAGAALGSRVGSATAPTAGRRDPRCPRAGGHPAWRGAHARGLVEPRRHAPRRGGGGRVATAAAAHRQRRRPRGRGERGADDGDRLRDPSGPPCFARQQRSPSLGALRVDSRLRRARRGLRRVGGPVLLVDDFRRLQVDDDRRGARPASRRSSGGAAVRPGDHWSRRMEPRLSAHIGPDQ